MYIYDDSGKLDPNVSMAKDILVKIRARKSVRVFTNVFIALSVLQITA